MVHLRSHESRACGRVGEEESVYDQQRKRSAESEPEERPAPAPERSKEPQSDNRQQSAKAYARARREGERDACGHGEHRAAPSALVRERQKEEPHGDEERREGVRLRNGEVVEVVEVRAQEEEHDERRLPAQPDGRKTRGERAEEPDAYGADGDRQHARAEEPVFIPDRRERRIHNGHHGSLGEEEVTIWDLALGHHPGGVEIPSLVLIERTHPDRRKRKHGESEGRQKPISLH